jgi:hypothetical protein
MGVDAVSQDEQTIHAATTAHKILARNRLTSPQQVGFIGSRRPHRDQGWRLFPAGWRRMAKSFGGAARSPQARLVLKFIQRRHNDVLNSR